jgi:hypothetical protein
MPFMRLCEKKMVEPDRRQMTIRRRKLQQEYRGTIRIFSTYVTGTIV